MYKEIKEKVLNKDNIIFDKKLALNYFADNYDAYNDFVKMYINNYNNIDKTLLDLYKSNNYLEITKIIHNIKGISIYTGCELFYSYLCYFHKELYNKNYTNLLEQLNLFIDFNKIIINYLMEE